MVNVNELFNDLNGDAMTYDFGVFIQIKMIYLIGKFIFDSYHIKKFWISINHTIWIWLTFDIQWVGKIHGLLEWIPLKMLW